ncbi:MAG: DUF5343 domain-containing protein [Planctomycetota bacterium]|jgi:hypothetical protein
MAKYPPFMNAYGQLDRVLDRIRTAQTPPRFTQDFLATKLGCPGGSPKASIPLLKRLGFLGSDGVPTDLYHQFRNPRLSGAAMAAALRTGYADLYSRNEYVHDLSEEDLKGLVMEATGLEDDAPTLRCITKSFLELRKHADFDAKTATDNGSGDTEAVPAPLESTRDGEQAGTPVGVGLSYTVNLNLPETTDIAVFNAIFKSLREHLLRR